MTKAQARIAAINRAAGQDPALGTQLTAHVLRDCSPPPNAIIAGYWPLTGEIDIRPLLLALAKTHTVTLPQTPPRGQPLIFRQWHPGDTLTQGRLKTQHPQGEILTPNFILIPLLAFDTEGNRLGYGGGYYDRTLAAHPNAYRLGCAFAAQATETLPTEPHDIKLQAIATEHGIQRF
jgi:5-formyltetrahydrofolate cyclo-ligase